MIVCSREDKKLYIHQITDIYASGTCIDFNNVDKEEILRIINMLEEIYNA